MHKEPGSQIRGPELRLSAPQKRCCVTVEGRDRWILGAHWPGMSSMLSVQHDSENKVESRKTPHVGC